MNDTVSRLMGMIDEYAESHSLTRGEREEKYQALQDELVKLFTPLTDEQMDYLHGEANRGYCIEPEEYSKAFRDAEKAHGITGEKNE